MSGAEATGTSPASGGARARRDDRAAGERLRPGDGSHLAQADQQDPYILYTIAPAYQGKGDAAKAKEFAQQAAGQHSCRRSGMPSCGRRP